MTMIDESKKAQIYDGLERILNSQVFAGSPRQQRFLRYVLEQSLVEDTKHLKGYTIGVEVFDRGFDFDPNLDSIVRVEAGRLRSKLREYYEHEGKEDIVLFTFPKGGYAIEITFRKLGEYISETNGDSPALKLDHKNFSIGAKPSLAVLPFTTISTDPSNSYFADGIADSFIFELSKLSGLFLVSRQSSFAYRNKALRADEIGLQLGVRYLLEGSVQHMENQIRISVQLSDTLTGGSIWTERYDREITSIFSLQDEITQNVVKMLNIKLAPSEKDMFGHEGTVSFDAYDSFMRGLEQHWKYTPHSLELAIKHFNQALVYDPEYAAAYAWLSRSMSFEWIMCWKDGDDILDRAYEHARTAVQLNKYLPYAHTALGWVELWRKNGPEAIAACRKGVSLDSNSADGFMFLSMSLSSSGLGEDALQYIEMGMRLSPNPSPFHLYALGQAHYVLGNYDQTISAWERGCELSNGFMPNHFYLCLLYTLLGRDQDCRRKREEIYARTNGKCAPVRPPWIDTTLANRHHELVKKSGMEYPITIRA